MEGRSTWEILGEREVKLIKRGIKERKERKKTKEKRKKKERKKKEKRKKNTHTIFSGNRLHSRKNSQRLRRKGGERVRNPFFFFFFFLSNRDFSQRTYQKLRGEERGGSEKEREGGNG